jgi:prepilin-type N-terminal cleavage/methylation domain-containing protein
MTLSATPGQAARPAEAASRQSGVSLIEVLVTLSILAVASAAIITTARPNDPLKLESARLERVIDRLEMRAQTTGLPTGLVVGQGEYSAAIWVRGEWQALSEHQHRLARGVDLTLQAAASPRETGQTPAPDIVFDPLGHSSLATLTLRHKGQSYTLDPAQADEAAIR